MRGRPRGTLPDHADGEGAGAEEAGAAGLVLDRAARDAAAAALRRGARRGDPHALPDGGVGQRGLAGGGAGGAEEWAYLRRALIPRFRLLAFDLRGHGRSGPAPSGDYSPSALAGDLAAVADLAGAGPAVLLGHSAGGMATLDLCRQFPERLGPRVAGLVLVNTTDHDPVRTTTAAGLFTAVRAPLLTPLLWPTVGLWPLLWLSSWVSYANGTAHLAAWLTGFAGRPGRGQLDAAARLNARTSPAVLARGVLGMFRYDARATWATGSTTGASPRPWPTSPRAASTSPPPRRQRAGSAGARPRASPGAPSRSGRGPAPRPRVASGRLSTRLPHLDWSPMGETGRPPHRGFQIPR